MPDSNPLAALKGFASSVMDYWWAAAGLASALVNVIAALINVPPPVLWPKAPPIVNNSLAAFVVTFIVTAVFWYRAKTSAAFAFWLMLAFAGVGVVGLILYGILYASWSCGFAGGVVVTGWSYVAAAAAYVSVRPGITCTVLIGDNVGSTWNIWPAAELIVRYAVLALSYLAVICSLSLAMLCAATVLRGGGNDPAPEPAPYGG